MKHLWIIGISFLLLQGVRAETQELAVRNDSLNFAGFGKIHLYEPAGAATAVVLFISGDGGWKNIVVDMANMLREQGALVAGIDIRHVFDSAKTSAEKCFYPAGDLEELSKAVQLFAHIEAYQRPILVGNSSGASLVYAALAEAPEGTFAGGISLGFCPDMEIAKAPCRGNGLNSYHVTKPVPAWILEPDPTLKTPWYVLQGETDQCCAFDKSENLVEQIPAAQLIRLPNVGHGFAVVKNWAPQFRAVFEKLNRPDESVRASGVQGVHDAPAAASKAAMPTLPGADLPLIVTPARSGSSERLVVLLSGDGGWKDFDQGIADGLAAQGMPVVGLNTLQYFWKERTPEAAAWDLTRIIQFYGQQFGKKEVLLVGYSFGAEVLPFLYNRLNDKEKKQIQALALLSPFDKADFAFHFSAWLNHSSANARPLAPELEKMYGCRALFLFGNDEDPGWVQPFIKGNFSIKILEGGHHYGGNTSGIAQTIGKM